MPSPLSASTAFIIRLFLATSPMYQDVQFETIRARWPAKFPQRRPATPSTAPTPPFILFLQDRMATSRTRTSSSALRQAHPRPPPPTVLTSSFSSQSSSSQRTIVPFPFPWIPSVETPNLPKPSATCVRSTSLVSMPTPSKRISAVVRYHPPSHRKPAPPAFLHLPC